jgi:hypothetical protein
MSEYRVAIVYLGPKLPRYLISNLKYLIKTFPQMPLVFISDNPKSINKVKRLDIDTWQTEALDEFRDEIDAHSSHPKNFRNGFWFNTTGRFKAIENFIAQSGLGVLQIEADVWLSPAFPFDYFEGIDRIGFPLESANTGAASILWVPNLRLAKFLTGFALEQFSRDGNATDMTILGNLAKKHQNKVHTLRSIPGVEQKESNSFGVNIGVFDPLTYGIYFFGEDGRNNRGKRVLHRQPTKHLIKADKSTLSYKNKNLKVAYLGVTEDLYCIHNHAKDIRLFKAPEKIINKRISEDSSTIKIEIVISDLIRVLFTSILRRVKMNKR